MAASDDIGARLERQLMSHGVYVERYVREGETLHVEYETAAAGLTKGDIGNVCAELREAVNAGWDPSDCRFWVFDTNGGFCGDWRVRAGWFRALDRGDISETDFSTLVLSTREPAAEPPAERPAFGGGKTH
ncbi:uncharacterized protein NP_0520A [Natronomonas pharaonis DSM 2160]|uniref:DUF8159 domain-containing protein n=1 Tax=Natronomonas pharaonis (strain ATCC 35678 / DSM 2160 / CIP 103997 / JCM 8858 / NBRC 14720 / NCIMB 2260 / Gabara) TaxID=348780 RepID=A0A1U7ETT8_NATPD|nr:hypothetical protein [Natronomonas pharaonis]CAI48351.1 uncharacterized protein NP_0520A [Natronomonas pharaonis DSM 2160]